jgi:hypothetical protein
MNAIPSLLALASLLAGQLGLVQSAEPVDDWKPATSNQRGKQYPQVNSEGRVKFHVAAPQAQNVTVSFRDSRPFVQGEDGAWTGINSHYYESPNTAHVWQSWRRSLYQFAPLLFQN